MAPRTDRTTRIPSGVASPVTTNHAAKGCVFVDLRNGGNLVVFVGEEEERVVLLQAGGGLKGRTPNSLADHLVLPHR